MRIRYMTLPEEWTGDGFKERFILILDSLTEGESLPSGKAQDRLMTSTGAKAIVTAEDDIEIGESK